MACSAPTGPAALSALSCSAPPPLLQDYIGPQMDGGARRILRRSWQQYMRRLARAAIGVSRWVQRLQQIAAPTELKSMHSLDAGAVEVGGLAS